MKYRYMYDPEYEVDYDFSNRHWSQPRRFYNRLSNKEQIKWQRRARQLQARRLRRLNNIV